MPTGDEDALDLLMQQYEQQAKKDCEAVNLKSAKPQLSIREHTQQALRQPIPKDNKFLCTQLEKVTVTQGVSTFVEDGIH